MLFTPLAQFTILTPSLHFAMVASSMRLLVSLVSGVCTVMKSDLAQMSSRSALSMPTCTVTGMEVLGEANKKVKKADVMTVLAQVG